MVDGTRVSCVGFPPVFVPLFRPGEAFMPVRRRSSLALSAGLAAALTAAAPALAQTAPAAQPPAPAAAPAPAPAAAPVSMAVPLLPAGPEGAKEIARQIDELVALSLAPKASGATHDWKGGAPVVTPKDDRYDIATPPLTIRWPDGASAEVGPATYQAVPQADGTLDLTGTPPQTFTMRSKDKDKERVDTEGTIGEIRFSGLWSPAYQALLKADFAANKIELRMPVDGEKATVAGFTLKQALARDSGDLHSGDGAWTVSGVSVLGKDGKEEFTLAKAAVEGAMTRVDLAKLMQFRRMTATTKPDALTPEKLLAEVRGLLAGFKSRFAVEGVRVQPSGEPKPFALKAAELRLGVDSLDSDKAGAFLALDVREPSGDFPPDVAPFVPSTTVVSLTARNVPSDLASQIMAAPGGIESPQASEVLLTALQKTGADVAIDGTSVETPVAAATAKGALKAQAGTAFGGVGKVTLTVRGMDTLMAALKPKPGKKADDDTQGMLAMLTMAQAMGQPGKDEQGRDLRTFDLELDDKGAAKLNGADLSALMPPAADKDDEDLGEVKGSSKDQPKGHDKGHDAPAKKAKKPQE
jgi:hypothetical protein